MLGVVLQVFTTFKYCQYHIEMSEKMHVQDGFENILNTDISQSAIALML